MIWYALELPDATSIRVAPVWDGTKVGYQVELSWSTSSQIMDFDTLREKLAVWLHRATAACAAGEKLGDLGFRRVLG